MNVKSKPSIAVNLQAPLRNTCACRSSLRLPSRFIVRFGVALAVTPLLGGCVTANMWAYGEPKSKWAKAAWTPLTVVADCTVIAGVIAGQSFLENGPLATATMSGARK